MLPVKLGLAMAWRGVVDDAYGVEMPERERVAVPDNVTTMRRHVLLRAGRLHRTGDRLLRISMPDGQNDRHRHSGICDLPGVA